MLKNKRIIGLLVGVCILLCSVVMLTMSTDKAKEDNLPDTSITDIDKSDTGDKETTDDSKTNPKDDINTDKSDTSQKSDTSSNKHTQTSPKEEKLPTQDSNQSQTNTETNTPTTPESTTEYVYVSIDCKTILNNMNDLPEQYKQYVPSNGIILSSKKVKLSEGDTVFDIITKVTKMNKIQMSQSSGYIQSIHNLPEKLFNGSGGWMYGVNGSYADRGSKEYKLKNNDKVEWRYTCYIGDLK